MPSSEKLEIKNSRRLLAVGYPGAGIPALLEGFTGSSPAQTGDTLAGLSHSWSVDTTYYTATVPIWLDEITTPKEWSKDFLSPEAREVLDVLGAFIVCFQKPINDEALQKVKLLLESVSDVVREGCGYSWDGVVLAVAMPQSITSNVTMKEDDWEDLCNEYGAEYIDFEKTGKNEFGEPTGVARLKEALEANDWAADDDELDLNDLDLDDEGRLDFGMETAQWEMEMREAVSNGAYGEDDDEEESVEKLEAMMLRMQAVKDAAEDLPESERKKYAARAVNDMMKSL